MHAAFPLEHLVAVSESIQDDLGLIKIKAASVSEYKESINVKVEDVHISLLKAKREWADHQKENRASTACGSGVSHNAGKLLYHSIA
jgi:hypothetical protein